MKKLLIILIVGFLSSGLISNSNPDQHIYLLKSQLFRWAGSIRIFDFDSARISDGQLKQLRTSVQPGDFFLTRKSYYLSNLGIPGFWTHASSYIGNPIERNIYFSNDSECHNWVKSMGEGSGSLENLLQKTFHDKYIEHTDNWLSRPIIESISEGVVFSPFSKVASMDRLVILRPQVTKLEIAKAIYHAFEMAGRPYDYNFDFSTETTIACSELVYRIYRESKLFAINQLFGNPFTTPNEIAKEYDEKFNTDKLRLKMIHLFDGDNVYDSNSIKGQQILRQSWRRSFW
jgi:hypothetical protein